MSEKKGMHDFDANNLIGIKDAQTKLLLLSS